MHADFKAALLEKVASVDHIPTLPTMALLLLHYIDRPLDNLLLPWVVELIGQDEAASAECIRLANSALPSRRVATVQAAVMALGALRVRDITVSACGNDIMPLRGKRILDPSAFWHHCLACALVSRKLARLAGFFDIERAYLAGLAHDLGIVAHWWLIPEEFEQAVESARFNSISLHQAEREILGLDHGETGSALSRCWRLGDDVTDVILFHHRPHEAVRHRGLVALVSLSDWICRDSGLGYGLGDPPPEAERVPAITALQQIWPNSQISNWIRGNLDRDEFLQEVSLRVQGSPVQT